MVVPVLMSSRIMSEVERSKKRSYLTPSTLYKLMTELKVSLYHAWRKFGVKLACDTVGGYKGDI